MCEKRGFSVCISTVLQLASKIDIERIPVERPKAKNQFLAEILRATYDYTVFTCKLTKATFVEDLHAYLKFKIETLDV